MFWLFLLVALSPTLMFKGLTLPIIWDWFQIHPFWFVFFLGMFFTRTVIKFPKTEEKK